MATNAQVAKLQEEVFELKTTVKEQDRILASVLKQRRDAVAEALKYERARYKAKLQTCKDDLNVDLVAFVTATLKLLNN